MAGDDVQDDEAAIERLTRIYNDTTDRHEWAGLADCFTDDGEFFGVYGSWRMREQIEEFGRRAEERAEVNGVTRHFVTNTLSDVDGDRAASRSFLMVTTAPWGGVPVITLTGEYEDELVKVDGQWRFRVRRVHVDGRKPS